MKKLYKFLKSNFILVLAVGGLIYGFSLFVGGGNSSANNDNTKIWVLAKHSVESNLKSPTSAKFPSQDKAKISKSNGRYVVKSYVDADNSFGASTRSKFTVVLTKDSSGLYKVESVKID